LQSQANGSKEGRMNNWNASGNYHNANEEMQKQFYSSCKAYLTNLISCYVVASSNTTGTVTTTITTTTPL
jgi:hypothetical protein